MKTSRRALFLFALFLAISSTYCLRYGVAETPNARTDMLVGVSLAGAEFGTHQSEFSNENPGNYGTDYTFPTVDTIQYFSKAGVDLVRLPFRWERIQPTLGGELDSLHLHRLRKVARASKESGMFVILDLHNYGRYRLEENGIVREYIIDQSVDGRVPVSRAHFVDLWKRLTLAFRGDRSVVGYGLMNEPHDMGGSDWKAISQAAVDEIRKYDRETAVVVAGDDWSSAERFWTANGSKAWIRDPSNYVVYEAHCYFDSDASGKYPNSFNSEKSADPEITNRGVQRVMPFLDWCHENGVRGLIGEYGTPRDPHWGDVTTEFLTACKKARVAVCYWAAGEWWGDYPLSIQPGSSRSTAPQLRWLQDVKKKKVKVRTS